MEVIVLSIHLLVCICLIGLVLLQRSEGGALGMGGGGGGSLMSGRGASDALARMTSVAGGFFLVTSLGLTVLSGAAATSDSRSVFDLLPESSAPATLPETAPAPAPETQPDPTESSVEPATQLASIGPAEAAAASPTGTRAAPLTTAPTTPARPPAQTASNTNTQPARTQPTAARSTPATTPPAPTRPLVLPETSGSVSGITLEDAPAGAESSEAGGVEAVRRERAGPDQ